MAFRRIRPNELGTPHLGCTLRLSWQGQGGEDSLIQGHLREVTQTPNSTRVVLVVGRQIIRQDLTEPGTGLAVSIFES